MTVLKDTLLDHKASSSATHIGSVLKTFPTCCGGGDPHSSATESYVAIKKYADIKVKWKDSSNLHNRRFGKPLILNSTLLTVFSQ